ncbi:MAG: superoxide dismutase [Opitutus sp.]|nr:superoxide dismutase [Opitutus sp.]
MNSHNATGMSRRDALKTLGAGVVLAGTAGIFSRTQAAEATGMATRADGVLGWELPELPYGYAALEPHFDARTMEIHHTKHHQAYISNARKLLEVHPELLAKGPEALVRDLASVPEAIRTGIRNNAGGHVNHAFFWRCLTSSPTQPGARFAELLAKSFGSIDDFKKQFADAAMKRFGSGWAWLVVTGLENASTNRLKIVSTANQDSPLSEGMTPVLGLDVWEHAYYLHYQSRRADYVNAFWEVVNWKQVEQNANQVMRG